MNLCITKCIELIKVTMLIDIFYILELFFRDNIKIVFYQVPILRVKMYLKLASQKPNSVASMTRKQFSAELA